MLNWCSKSPAAIAVVTLFSWLLYIVVVVDLLLFDLYLSLSRPFLLLVLFVFLLWHLIVFLASLESISSSSVDWSVPITSVDADVVSSSAIPSIFCLLTLVDCCVWLVPADSNFF
jgi:hypothetical protein